MMKTVFTMLLFLGSMMTFFGAICAIGGYRRARLGPGYRGEKDAALWLALVVLGGVLSVLIYFITQAMHPFLQ